jgi:hypothetical protein
VTARLLAAAAGGGFWAATGGALVLAGYALPGALAVAASVGFFAYVAWVRGVASRFDA